MPKVSPSYLVARRDELLEAALICFARNGFHKTAIQDIAREAGVSHGAIYRYFSSKDEVIQAVSRRDRGTRARRFEEAVRGRTAIEALGRLLETAAQLQAGPEAAERRRLNAQVLGEGVRNAGVNETIRETWGDVIEGMGAIVRRGQAEGDIDPDLAPDAVARVLAAIHDGLVVHQAVDPGTDIAASLDVVGAMLRGAFAGNGERQREARNDGQRALRLASD